MAKIDLRVIAWCAVCLLLPVRYAGAQATQPPRDPSLAARAKALEARMQPLAPDCVY